MLLFETAICSVAVTTSYSNLRVLYPRSKRCCKTRFNITPLDFDGRYYV